MSNELLKLARPEIVAMEPYRSARSENKKGHVWLDANEYPWNDMPYNRYPEPQPQQVITALAALYHVKQDEILVTRGVDEGIDLLVRLFCRAGTDKIMICPPTYGMYSIAAKIQGAGIVEIPLLKNNDFSLDLPSILKQWDPAIKLVFLCSPNNPTGNIFNTSDILELCKKFSGKAFIIVDEAYIEFAESQSMTNHLRSYANLIILRTLSKAFGLAGARCGSVIAESKIIQLLKKIIAPYPIPKPIADHLISRSPFEGSSENIAILKKERTRMQDALQKSKAIKKIWTSQANFILFEAYDAPKILSACLAQGIVIRDRGQDYQLQNCIRVTVGTPIENDLFLEVVNHA